MRCERKVWISDPETGVQRIAVCFAYLDENGQCPVPQEHAWDDYWENARHR